jgi:hypothetical protein
MLRRYGFRRILPIVQLGLFIVLVSIGAWQMSRWPSHSNLRPVVFQENENLPEWHPEPNRVPSVWLIAIAINVPATMLGALCAELFHIGSNFSALLCSMPFVLILWHLVGRWLDRQLGLLPFRSPGIATRAMCWFGILASAVLLAVGLMAVRSHTGITIEVLSLAVGWIAWSSFLLAISLLTLRRRKPGPAAAPA